MRPGSRTRACRRVYYKINRPVSWRQGDVEIDGRAGRPLHDLLPHRLRRPGDRDPGRHLRDPSRTSSGEEIAPARTFALMQDVARLQEMGLVKGGSWKTPWSSTTASWPAARELRFADECVRHKILDLLGDLALLGMPIQGHVTAKLSGHAGQRGIHPAAGQGRAQDAAHLPAAQSRILGHRLHHGDHAPPLPVPAGGPDHRSGTGQAGRRASRT